MGMLGHRNLDVEEIDFLVKLNLCEYMLRNGAIYATDMSIDHQGRRTENGVEFTLSLGQQKGCVVTRFNSGNWHFFMRDYSAKGDIRN
jgi:hypothetical protein